MKPRRGDDCVGYVAGLDGANLDVSGRSDAPLVLRDSNSGTLSMPMGSVCHNICKNLDRLGEDVRLCTMLGYDTNGRTILEGCMTGGRRRRIQ